ncbi:MAG: PSD1 and planctomycete cytochrome C domain-containing protein [Pirellulaceae bacterium]|nr:PSD1 and planctomycete cytochrome C domain-containing protein [Pirellulaceae bacterium]
MTRYLLIVFALCLIHLGATPYSHGQSISFNRQIRPILSENCFSCHGFDPKHREADLRLDQYEGATQAIDGHQAIVPGDVESSEIWRRILSDDPDVVMPPPKSQKPKLTAEQRTLIKQWIEEGAKYETHWSFTTPVRPDIKATGSEAIDHFILEGLSRAELHPSPEAPLDKLIRRVSLDLIGLPPSTAEIDRFLADSARDPEAAYSALVDRLLQSPHYGERWGRWWLDQARYADSNGYSIDAPRSIWKYRDWVINALNTGMPFDQFTIEQLAGDLLPDATESQKIATGFHRNTTINQEGGIDVEQFRVESVFDRVATTGTVWLGLTIGCAQCHDHKFDPIEQREFYQLFAFMNNQDEPTLKVNDPSFDEAKLTAELKACEEPLAEFLKSHRQLQSEWESTLAEPALTKVHFAIKPLLTKPIEERTIVENSTVYASGPGAADQVFRALNEKFKAALELRDGGITTMVLQERAEPRRTTIFTKGDFTRPADEVGPGTPAKLHRYSNATGKNNRLDLARWIVSPENPLTARVIANRVWQQFFGRGIVETENDFGSQGASPTHPELLDWLATEFIRQGWSLKELQRTIVCSKTYRQSSIERPEIKQKDPNNYLLGRQQRLRLDAELVRDSALAACGLLSEKIGGPPVFPPIPTSVMSLGQVKRAWNESTGEDRYRRGLYTFVYRATPAPSLVVFDAPDGQNCTTRRVRSNTPLQALTLLNDTAFFEFATALKGVIDNEGLEAAFRRCTSRQPTANELEKLTGVDSLTVARVLLNLDETVTRD